MSPEQALPPEQRAIAWRDFALLFAGLAVVVAPHALRAPWWLTLLTAALVAWRALALVHRGLLPSIWVLLLIVAAGMLGVWLEYRAIFGRTPGIMLLVLFAGLKVLESRNQRDAVAVVFLIWFLAITNFLYTQSIPTALGMCVAVAASVAALVGLAAPRRAPGANLRTAGLLLGQAVPAALVLFLLFPRVQGPLWGLPQDAYSAMSGLSDSMSPGSLSQLTLSDAIAFRVDFEGELPPRRTLYWRGPVLWDFDGRTWRLGSPALAELRPLRGGTRVEYGVLLEPHNRNWLFALEAPGRRPPRARFLDDGQVVTPTPVRTRIRYERASRVEADPEPTEDRHYLLRALRLPPGFNPRARELAAEWRESSASDVQVLQRAVEHFRRERLQYTTEPRLLGRDSVDEFLFDSREGFCEHFSSAFVFLMRAAGVPARVVTGYQGGDQNPVDGKFTVRQSDAHAWSEVFLRGRGWVRVDPTVLSVPRRLDGGLARAVTAGAALPLLMRPELEWLRTLRYNWEALTHQWNLWVLGYNPERQRDLMARLGVRDADWVELASALFALLGAFVGALLLWSLSRTTRPDPVQAAWLAFCRKLGARGVARSLHEGPRDYSERAARALPSAREAILAIAALYIALRYRSWQRYRGRFVNETRIAEGAEFARRPARALARAAEEHGVPEEIIVAIIGIETIYGRQMGVWRVIDALSTLAFDYPPRAEFFRSELEQFLLYSRETGIDVFSVRGSYAGAIGIPQFMPGSYRRFAVDFDGDGIANLRQSPVDAIGSVANFLAKHGWRRGERIELPARVVGGNAGDSHRKLLEAGAEPKTPLGELKNFGVETRTDLALDTPAALIERENSEAPAEYRIGLRNFYVLTRYNRSVQYASAAVDLAQETRKRR